MEAYSRGLDTASSLLKSLIYEITNYWDENPISSGLPTSDVEKIELICNRFDRVARQLEKRHKQRSTLKIEDEYDAQDLFHSLLTLYFDDIRDEEYVPSYGGSCSRVDFLLKPEKIFIELKKTSQNSRKEQIGSELITDIKKYQQHPDCSLLFCFVYDPEKKIVNPRELENDLSKRHDELEVKVLIRPL